MKFNHLNVPDSWKHYWTRYPEGYTILEALISWVSQVDSMVDNQNKLNTNVEQFRKEIDDFVGRFDERLQTEVTQTLKDWQDSGFLDVVISEALQWQLDDYIATNEQDKLSLTTQLAQTMQKESVTFNIPSDYATLQQAIDELSTRKHKQGVMINLNIESNHRLTQGVTVVNGSYNHFRIISEDPIVYLANTFPPGENIILGEQAKMPVLACLIDSQGLGQSGYVALKYSTGLVENKCGVMNLIGDETQSDQYGTGLLVRESEVYALGSIFSGNRRNVWVTRTGRLFGDNSDFSGATGDYQVFITRSSLASISNSNLKNAANIGLAVYRSWVTAIEGIDISNAGDTAILSDGSHIVLNKRYDTMPNISQSGKRAIYAVGSSIVADSLQAENCGEYGIFCVGSRVYMPNSLITFNEFSSLRVGQIGIRGDQASTIDATGTTIVNAGLRGVMARDASTVNIQGGSVKGSLSKDLYADRGGIINANNTTTTKGVGKPHKDDTNSSTGFNVISPFGSIIWGNDTIKKVDGGSKLFDGDGVTTAFTFTHSLGVNPTIATVQPGNSVAGNARIKYVSTTAETFTVFFDTPPLSGTENVFIKWKVEIL